MKKRPLISVIVPVYNVAPYLKKCVASICTQEYKNLEIILVNDGSTDDSGALCDSFSKMDSRIKVIHKKNGGLSDARNVALDHMTGDYVTFIDSDDWVTHNYISCLYKMILQFKCQIAVGSYRDVDIQDSDFSEEESQKQIYCKYLDKKEAIEALLYQKYFSTAACCKLYKAELWKNSRFPVNKLYEDVIAIYEIFSKAERIAFSNQIIYYYLQRSDSIVRDNFSIRKMDYVYNMREVLRRVQKDYPELERAALSRLFWAEIHVLVHMQNSKLYQDIYTELWENIKEIRLSVILDPKSRLQNKAVAMLSYGGNKVLKGFFNLYKYHG